MLITMEELFCELRSLNKQISELCEREREIRLRIAKKQRAIKEEQEEQELVKMRNYLIENHVFFGSVNIQILSHAMESYDIGFYIYQLDTFGLDVESIREQHGRTFDYVTYPISNFNIHDICIKHVPLPRNSIEERLYPYVKAYLEPHLPIKFTLEDKYVDDYYTLKPNCDVNIRFNTSYTSGTYLGVYYLKTY